MSESSSPCEALSFSFDRLLDGCPILVSIETDRPRTLVVVGMDELESAIVDHWPAVSGHQKSAAEFGTDFFGLRDPGRWAWDDAGRPQRHVLAHGDAIIAIYPLPTAVPGKLADWMREKLNDSGSANAFATWAMSPAGTRQIANQAVRRPLTDRKTG